MSETIYLSFSDCCVSLSIIHSSSVQVDVSGKNSSFRMAESYSFVYMEPIFFIHPLVDVSHSSEIIKPKEGV